MAKETYVRFRCTEEFKEQVDQAAKMENRSTSNYVENLIIDDLRKKGIIKYKEV